MGKIEQDKAFWKAYFALEQTLKALNKAVQGRPSEKAKPPKGRAVALSTTCQELFVVSGDSLNYA